MRDEIIKRNTLIMIISLLLFFVLSLFITSYTSRKSIEKQLINVSTVINNQILETNTEDELNDVVDSFTKNQEWLQITIISSVGVIIKDSSNDSINESVTNVISDKEIETANFDLDKDRIYLKDNKIYFITKINNDIIVQTSVHIEDNTELILISLFYLMILLIVVIILSYLYSKKVSKNIIDTFNELSLTLKSINEGKYVEIDTVHKYSEVQEILNEINEINNNTYASMLTIRNEHQKLDFVINNMQQGIMIVNKHGNMLLINDYAKESLHIETDVVDTTSYKDIIKNQTLLEKIEKAILSKNNYFFDIEDEVKSKIYSCTINYLRNKWADLNKDERLYVIVIMDVTEEREIDKNKADFISNASHELKTPITSIRGFSELLLVGADSYDEKTKKYLNIIYNESVKMKDTIEDLLYLSNLQHHRKDESLYEEIYFEDVIDEVVEQYRALAQKENIKILVDVDNSSIFEQAKLVTHLIKNLVENAIKYNKENSFVKISVKSEKRNIILEVADGGIGIEEKHLDKIFDRFYRVDESHNRSTGGSGIGLNIVKQICNTLNAKISVHSKVNEGTTFIVIFNKNN